MHSHDEQDYSRSAAGPAPARERQEETAPASSGRETATIAPARARRMQEWLIAGGILILLIGLALIGLRLTTGSRTIDQVVISTVPSGADVKFDSQWLGHSPVKLEDVAAGVHTIEISKEGYDSESRTIDVVAPQTVDFKLRRAMPDDLSTLSPEERIRRFQERGEQAFARGFYAIPYDGSALHYADLIRIVDDSNEYSKGLRERVRESLHRIAGDAVSRGELGEAQEIYSALVNNYPDDQAARNAAAKLETQLSSRRGDVRDLIRRAELALQAGKLTDPPRANAYYYSKLVLAIDHRNTEARAIRDRIKERFVNQAQRAFDQGNVADATRYFEQAVRFFPEDMHLASRLREIEGWRVEPLPKTNLARERRIQGLQKFSHGEYSEALQDLEYADRNDEGTSDVLAVIGQCYLRMGQLDRAEDYFNRVPHANLDARRAAVTGLAEIAERRNDIYTALVRYEDLRALGGSQQYTVEALNSKIERLEKRQREKEADASPIAINVIHTHGAFGGTCHGVLTVNRLGVRYDGDNHTFSDKILAASVLVTKDGMTVAFNEKGQKFRAQKVDAERFREALNKFQATRRD